MTTATPLLSKPAVTAAMTPKRTLSQNGQSQASSPLIMHVRHMVAGVGGGVISTLILHPLDLIKIRFQVNEGLGVAARPQYSGILNAAASIVRQQGIHGLYQGIAPNVMGTGASWGVYFLSYNVLKTRFQHGDKEVALSAPVHMLVAAEAGVVTLLLTNPILVSKTRLCLQYESTSSNKAKSNLKYYTGMVDCLSKTYKSEGFRGLYKGFVPGLFGISHGSIQFMVYEELKKHYASRRHVAVNTKLKTEEYILFAAISKIVASSLTYPYQVLRSRLQDQHRCYTGLMDVIRQTYRLEGAQGFFKGLTPYLCHVTPNVCIVFLIYETVVNYNS